MSGDFACHILEFHFQIGSHTIGFHASFILILSLKFMLRFHLLSEGPKKLAIPPVESNILARPKGDPFVFAKCPKYPQKFRAFGANFTVFI